MPNQIWYRGTNTPDLISNNKNLDELGPGIYFTSSKDDAETYGKNIHEVTFAGNLIPKKKFLALRKQMIELVKQSEDWESTSQNWNENPIKGLNIFINSAISDYNSTAEECFLQVWIDFYRYNSMGYINGMIKLGWDGFIKEKNLGVKHLVVYNKDKINKISQSVSSKKLGYLGNIIENKKNKVMTKKDVINQVLSSLRKKGMLNEDTIKEFLAKKKLNEKWDTDYETPSSKKGMFKGKNKTELEHELANLKKSGPHKEGSAEYTKEKELNFALRAKSGWK